MKTENIILNGVEYCPVAVDKFKDLKIAYSEGATIECKLHEFDSWDRSKNPMFNTEFSYRIKGDISISSWNAHKDIIKQYWEGVKIESKRLGFEGQGFYDTPTPTWTDDYEYRVKKDIYESRGRCDECIHIGELKKYCIKMQLFTPPDGYCHMFERVENEK